MKFSFMDIVKSKIRGTFNINQLVKDGLKIGNNVNIMGECIIDPGHCWLIEIGDNVTLAPRVHVLAHDASTKKFLGYTRIAKVKIGNNVFVGAGSIILPGVTIEDNVIIGAGSVVTKDCQTNGVYAGNPARQIANFYDYLNKHRKNIESVDFPVFDETYKIGNITDSMKEEMKDKLSNCEGYIV